MSIAKYIDHTVLKPFTTVNDVQQVCSEASQYGFASVCVPPYFVKDAAAFLTNPKVKVCTVIGFPFGYHSYKAKSVEAKKVIKEGANELDMVMNIAAFKNKDYDLLKKEIRQLSAVSMDNNVVLKVIIESGMLSGEEIIICCDLYKEFVVDFLKTSTGYAETGATIDAVQIMRTHLPSHIQVKASGGIKTFEFAQKLLDAGATRLGCSASVAIVNKTRATERKVY